MARILPFRGTEGHAQHDTSRNRQGVKGENQEICKGILTGNGPYGATRHEVSKILGRDGGPVSGSLSVMHKVGKICMLEEKRGNCHVYVMPEYVNNRPTCPPRSNAAHRLVHDCWDAWQIGDVGEVEEMLRRYCEAAPR